MSRKHILITGITGFVGLELLTLIKKDSENFYYLLVRKKSKHKLSQGDSHLGENIQIIEGNLKYLDLLTEDISRKDLQNKITHIIHLAATYDFKATSTQLYKGNVLGTQNLLYFAGNCPNLYSLIYASTIAVAGDFTGVYSEEDYDLGQKFSHSYGKTKFQAEGLVRNFSQANSSCQVSVLRLGVVVGNSVTGKVSKWDGPYYFFNFLTKLFKRFPQLKWGKVLPFPYAEKSLFPLVPVDIVANVIFKLIGRHSISGLKTYHILAQDLPSFQVFLKDYLATQGIRNHKIIALPDMKFPKKMLPFFNIPEELWEYLYFSTRYTAIHFKNSFPELVIKYDSFKYPLFSFLKESDGRVT